MKNRNYDLNERLLNFAVQVLSITEIMFTTRAGNHIASQLVRSSTSPVLQYGEAMASESTRDFIHKFKILLKELRETMNGLKLVQRVPLTKEDEIVASGISECNELIAIFVTSIETAQANDLKKRKRYP